MGEIDALQRLGHMKLARLAGGWIDAIEVENAEGRIAGGLYFGHQDSFAQGVDSAAGKIEAMAGADWNGVDQRLDRSVGDAVGELLLRHAGLEPLVEFGARVVLDHIPRLA